MPKQRFGGELLGTLTQTKIVKDNRSSHPAENSVYHPQGQEQYARLIFTYL